MRVLLIKGNISKLHSIGFLFQICSFLRNPFILSMCVRMCSAFRCMLVFNMYSWRNISVKYCDIASKISSKEVVKYNGFIRRTLEQLRTNKSPFFKSYLHKVDAESYLSPLCPLCNTYTHNMHQLFNFTHIRTTLYLDFWKDPVKVTELLFR